MVLVDCARAFFPFFFDVALLLGRRFLPILFRRWAATWASVSSHSFSTLLLGRRANETDVWRERRTRKESVGSGEGVGGREFLEGLKQWAW